MPLLSVRMRASLRGDHVSGAERIIEPNHIPHTLLELLRRPKDHDFLKITLERLENVEEDTFRLPIKTYTFDTTHRARDFALQELIRVGIPPAVAKKGITLLSKGANPKGGNMRGAVLMDIESGERLEPNMERGVRTVRVDWRDRFAVRERLLKEGFTDRTLDALAIAFKNLKCGVIAELCWSDDPDYLTGYVASMKGGYVRITPLKDKGDPLGGRIYFIRKEGVRELIECLERKALLLGM